MSKTGVAITGTGFMGPAHLEGLRRLGIDVVGIQGSTPEKSKAAAARLGLRKAYASFDEILDDDEVTVVHLTTPNRVHFATARDALRAGKHVHSEKPLAMNAQESAELVALAEETGLLAGVNYNIRFYPLNIEARARIQAGELGDVFSVYGSYVQDWLLYPTDYNWRVLAEEGGALRAVADIGTHWMDLMQMVTGLEITGVYADLKTVHHVRRRPTGEVETFSAKVQEIDATEEIDIDTEDCGSILLRFKGGAVGNLWVSQLTAGRKNALRYEIAGAKRALAWNSESPNDLWIGERNAPNQQLIRDPGLVSAAARTYITYPGGHNEGYDDTFKQCFKAFYDYLHAGDFSAPKPFPTFADGHREIVLCEAVLRSHREQCWVDVVV
ncbi:MAG: Gfo/Idh/MocA family oxidoreductase [Caldilineaceae bacterium]|nr:Gfo/Idh/MocA family oxidoreductase [Caldilineaceae bacterium]